MGNGRYSSTSLSSVKEGWRLSRLCQPSRLHGANGIRTGADGQIYVAQVTGSCITALNPDTGAAEMISAIDGPITAPDDLAFDDVGNIFVTEITKGVVSMLSPNGDYRVINGDFPVANPITVHQGRLFAGQCFPGGQVVELDIQTGAKRVIMAEAPMPNAFSVGPDGMLYMPMMATNEIWRVSLDGGPHEVVAGDLGVPDSVKFDSKGRIVSTQVASGQVLRIDPQTGAKEVLAQCSPGLDNCTFVGDRIFVSSISGHVSEILPDGVVRPLVEEGLQWPMGLCVTADGLHVADGAFSYRYAADGSRTMLGFFFTPGYPGFSRGVAADTDGSVLVTTANGQVMRWHVAQGTSEVVAEGYTLPFGVAVAPDGAVVFADGGTGEVLRAYNNEVTVLAKGLDRPMGVAITADGIIYVGEAGLGRVVKITHTGTETLIDGLSEPQGLAVRDGALLILDVGARALVSVDLATGEANTLATALPVKAPPGVAPKILGGVGTMSGPMEPFAGVAVDGHGTIYIAGDAEGSILTLSNP